MRLFFSYLRQRRRGMLAFLLFCAVFICSFLLYRLPARAVLYPALFCALLGLMFLLRDFSRALKKHRMLVRLQGTSAETGCPLPEAQGLDDEDYQAVIRALREEAGKNSALAAERYQELVEYYTVWVHQIKTPITSMRLSLEKEDTALSRRLSSDLLQIEQYVGMVLVYLRLGGGSHDYVFKEYALDGIVEQSIAKFAGEFILRRIRLQYAPSGETVVTDEKWLAFVIEQLLSNALKYTRAGEIRIALREPKTLCIEDTGIGIAPGDLPRVFEKGYTGYNGRADKRASGIGLYLCRRICTELGIDIRITSEPGKGTAVLLDLTQYSLKNE